MTSIVETHAPILSENALKVLENRYLRKNAEGKCTETPAELFRRVASNIAEAERNYGGEAAQKEWSEKFLNVMQNLEFLPNSPTLMNAGTEVQQLAACFVLPVGDSMESIFDSVKHMALVHKSGGGTGFSFSRLRPEHDIVQSTKGVSSGPVSFIGVFDAATEAVKQGGRRRGANMGILRVDHPDIRAFVDAKKDGTRLNNFNISVALTADFIAAVEAGADYALVNPRTGREVERIDAASVFDAIVDAAWRNGEPGIIFLDRINAHNPTPHIGEIESTNPCGEQPLLAYESCILGSINLSRMVAENGEARVDYERLGRAVTTGVRFLDNAIDMNRYPLAQIEERTKANRKIGLGVMGFADMLAVLGIPYDSDEAVELGRAVMRFIGDRARDASNEIASERGAFANFTGSVYDQPDALPTRNATTTTIAPTGSISILADTSGGIEPMFALAFKRRVLDGDGLVEVSPVFRRVAEREGFYSDELMERVAETGTLADESDVPERWRRVFKTAHEISPAQHVRMQAAFQAHTDNAVSKTVNLPGTATRDDVRSIYLMAHELGCKGLTVYRDGSRDAQVLETGRPSHNGGGERRAPKRRPRVVSGSTQKVPTGCGSLYVTINDQEEHAFELFAQIGKAGGCAASQTEAIGRLISLALRSGVEPNAVFKQLRGIRCSSPAWDNGTVVMSCADAMSKALEAHVARSNGGVPMETLEESRVNRLAGQCVDCGGPLEYDGGCAVCRACGYSRCG